jgi:hypothetical protein
MKRAASAVAGRQWIQYVQTGVGADREGVAFG